MVLDLTGFEFADDEETGLNLDGFEFEDSDNEKEEDDSALEYSYDRAQELFGRGIKVGEDLLGTGTGLGQSIVDQQAVDIKEGNYKPDYHGSFLDQDGTVNKLGWTWEKILENAATSVPVMAGTAIAALTTPMSVIK